MRYRAQGAADLAWRSADAVLRSRTKSNLFVWLPVLGIVLAVAHHDGWYGLVANAQNLIETWAGRYAAVRSRTSESPRACRFVPSGSLAM
jgi:hypothetical protein